MVMDKMEIDEEQETVITDLKEKMAARLLIRK